MADRNDAARTADRPRARACGPDGAAASSRAAERRAALRRYRSLMRLYARMDLNWLTQDTRSCVICMLSDVLSMASSVSAVLLLAVRFGGVGGLSEAETLFMLGFVTMGDGLFSIFFGNFNIAHISRRIGRSQLDHMMIQPLALPLQLATEGFAPFTYSGPLICGLGITGWALSRLGGTLAWWAWPAMILLLACAVAITLGMSYLISSAAFYRPVSCEEISSVMLDSLSALSRFPLGGLGPLAQAALLSVLPAGLLGWFPALIILGKVSLLPGLLLPVAVAAGACTLAALAFERGLRHYVKVGSNRYKSIGHRS